MLMRPFWLRVVATLLAPAGLAACAGSSPPPPPPSCELPAVTGARRAADNVPVFTLPDTGGFVVNGAPVARARVGPLLREVFAPRAPEARAAVVWRPTSAARCADVAFVAAQARAAGGDAYDAARSGWPEQIPAPDPRRP